MKKKTGEVNPKVKKRIIALLLAMLVISQSSALAQGFDWTELMSTPDTYSFVDEVTQDMVVRAVNQPFIGASESGELIVYLDYVQLAQDGQVLLRLTVSTALDNRFSAETLTFTVDKKVYEFAVSAMMTEYDRTYYSDYTVCFHTRSLPMLKAIAQRKKDDPLTVTLTDLDGAVVTGQVIIPGQTAADMYDRFIDLGGKKQDMTAYEDLWPVTITNAK